MYKYMFYIEIVKPNDKTRYGSWEPGNNEEQAKQIALDSAVNFHNRYNDNKLTQNDLTIVKSQLSGDYETVLKDLERG